MKILFVSSGNSSAGISPIILNQGKSLSDLGYDVSYFTIKGKGLKGYLKNIFSLRSYLKNMSFDIIHAHYSLSAMVASLAGAKPIVVSLMGSDVKAKLSLRIPIFLFGMFSWKKIIVKSQDMKKSVGNLKNLHVIPNGVDLSMFKPLNQLESINFLGWDKSNINILFLANPARGVKNYDLANKAVLRLRDDKIKLHALEDVDHQDIPKYINAADVVLLTSKWEGSPNVIKEAMACGLPIVSTDVGDVSWLFEGASGCFLVDHTVTSVSQGIEKAINFSRIDSKSTARTRIISLGLGKKDIANRIIEVYKTSLNNTN